MNNTFSYRKSRCYEYYLITYNNEGITTTDIFRIFGKGVLDDINEIIKEYNGWIISGLIYLKKEEDAKQMAEIFNTLLVVDKLKE